MHARNSNSGSPIVTLIEHLRSRTSLVSDGFARHDGELRWTTDGVPLLEENSTEPVAFCDADGEQVEFGQVELYEPEAEAGCGKDTAPPDGPAASGGNSAARAAERWTAEMKSLIPREVTAPGDGGENPLDAFIEATKAKVAGIRITRRLECPDEMENSPTRADEATIEMQEPGGPRIHCIRNGKNFTVDRITATEAGCLSRTRPEADAVTLLDLYARIILHAWGV